MPAREADAAFDEEGRPSKTQKKLVSKDLQDLGDDLVNLPLSRLRALAMPDLLREAIEEMHRTRSHEGRRRQLQYIGKLMRSADPEPLREAVAAFKLGQAQDAVSLHQAELWRERLIKDGAALTEWLETFPHTDAQQLRTLVRNARAQAEVAASAPPGEGPRHGRAYRELFQLIKEQLSQRHD